MNKIALVVGLVAVVLGLYGAFVTAPLYAAAHRHYMSARSGSPGYDAISARRDEYRGSAQAIAMGTIVASAVGLALSFATKKRDGKLPMPAVALSALGLVGAVIVLSKDVF